MNCTISSEVFALIKKSKELIYTEPLKAIDTLEKANTICEKSNFTLGKAHYFLNLSLVHRVSSNTTDWIDTAFKALELFMMLNDKDGISRSLNSLGSAYVHLGDFEEALLDFLQAQEINNAQDCVDNNLSIRILNNIGEVYRNTLDYEKAYEYYNLALEKSESCEYDYAYATVLTNVGLALISESRFEDAKINLEKSYEIVKENNDTIVLGEIETQLGFIYYQENNFEKAMEYYNSALLKLNKVDNKYYLIELLINIGKLKLETNANDALSYFNNAIDISLVLNCNRSLSIAYDLLYKYFEEKGNFKTALHYHKKYHDVTETIVSNAVSTKLEILKIKFKNNKLKNYLDELVGINDQLKTEVMEQCNKIKSIEEENFDLRYRAFHDELTKLPNRYAITSKIESYWKEAFLSTYPIVCFIIDIDNFKKYNDFWGHPQGDRCIATIAKCLEQIPSEYNTFCGRYGGEEFIYIAENLSYERALQLGNELRKRIKGLSIRYGDSYDSPSVTISLGGVYGTIDELKSSSNMINMADKQLYVSKNSGRDNLNIIDISTYDTATLDPINSEVAVDLKI